MIPNPYNPVFVDAYRSALIDQGLILLLSGIALLLAWAAARRWLPAKQDQGFGSPDPGLGRPPEPAGHRVLRIGFGLLWVLDGLLKLQPAMPVGIPYQVAQPAAEGSPGWVRDLVNWSVTRWSQHPIASTAATVWIELGLGLWLLTASHGRWSRAAGLASAAWGLSVWAFAEAFGGIFASGSSILTGTPGPSVSYAFAGLLLVLPARAWYRPLLGKTALAGLAVYLGAMAALQAWPGNGFWGSQAGAKPDGMADMGSSAAPPGLWTRMLDGFGNLQQGHPFAVNLFTVLTLTILALGLAAGTLAGRRRLLRTTVAAALILCAAAWVFVENFGFLGGLGTDPDLMPPVAALIASAYLALARLPEPGLPVPRTGWDPAGVTRPHRLAAQASFRSVASLGALGMILAGALPALAAQGENADPALARSLASGNAVLNYPATPFRLADQSGRSVSLTGLRGKVVLLAFIDPDCGADCPPLAAEFDRADQILGSGARHVQLVAIATRAGSSTTADSAAFTRQARPSGMPNWLFLTGTSDQLQEVWKDYAIAVRPPGPGTPSGRSDVALVIDPAGQVRSRLEDDQALWTTAGEASFATLLADTARQAGGAPSLPALHVRDAAGD